MRTALCTTTIHIPRVLDLYRAYDPDVTCYVASDEHPQQALYDYCANGICFLEPRYQINEWKCGSVLPWKSLSRRNLAFLAALKDGADIVISVDDDNMPMSESYFWDYEHIFETPFNGLAASSDTHWFDPGQLLVPQTKHRGIPHGRHRHRYETVTNAKIGAAAGLVLGDPDIDATTRIEHYPDIHQVSQLAHSGVIVSHCIHAVFNSQNSAVLREFVPAWFMPPGVGRHDDIFASLIVQRVMRDRGYHVHFGRPFAWQQRNEHNLISDLRKEIDGYENVVKLADLLDRMAISGESVIDDVRTIYDALDHTDYIPKQAIVAAMAWLDDCERVMR